MYASIEYTPNTYLSVQTRPNLVVELCRQSNERDVARLVQDRQGMMRETSLTTSEMVGEANDCGGKPSGAKQRAKYKHDVVSRAVSAVVHSHQRMFKFVVEHSRVIKTT